LDKFYCIKVFGYHKALRNRDKTFLSNRRRGEKDAGFEVVTAMVMGHNTL
jgi:hypothetical protein